MIVDTSVWIEFLRGTRTRSAEELTGRIVRGEPIMVPETVIMELLSGSADEAVTARRRRLLFSFDVVPAAPLVDSLRAAALQRSCRRSGVVVRSLNDCLIAAVALRLEVPVLHRDPDFETLAACSPLRTVNTLLD